MAAITFPAFTVSQKVPLSVAPTDRLGNPVPGGTFTWTVNDPAVATIEEMAADTRAVMLVAHAVGNITVTVTDGVLTDTADSSVVAEPAVAMNLTAGPAVDQ